MTAAGTVSVLLLLKGAGDGMAARGPLHLGPLRLMSAPGAVLVPILCRRVTGLTEHLDDCGISDPALQAEDPRKSRSGGSCTLTLGRGVFSGFPVCFPV
ncbi:hypothetical protein [Streptomyces sp. NPDC088348]|uniref:hypothetical protein n=1 Tax=Streptomyces sp. NPDC088348 TaxID=3365853 RepID=UPI003814966F